MSQLILAIDRCRTLTVAGIQGHIASPFIGITLAFDFRLASPDMTFMCRQRDGIPPWGALGFFLPRYVGLAKARNIVYRRQRIAAKEALQMGLVDDILPRHSFGEDCVAASQQIVESAGDFAHAKELMRPYTRGELEAYLDREHVAMANVWMNVVGNIPQDG